MAVQLGLVGWRGMVGSVLLDRMEVEGDFENFSLRLYSTSQVGIECPPLPNLASETLLDAHDIASLARNDIILTCQGGDYTKKVYAELRATGWEGFWIDAASTLRMEDECCIVLDPVNGDLIEQSLARGVKTFAGGNCTVSLLLMALAPLFQSGNIEWLSSMTYQAASGAGARQMKELLKQGGFCTQGADFTSSAIALESHIQSQLGAQTFPQSALGAPLSYNLLPYIDIPVAGGQSREEWKGEVEVNKLLGNQVAVPVDGICVRVPVLRCHSQAFLLKLHESLDLEKLEEMLASSHEWIDVVPDTKEDSLARLTPAAISGSLTVAVGRLRQARMGAEYLTGFTVGDQLLWGAAEPLRRMALILKDWLQK